MQELGHYSIPDLVLLLDEVEEFPGYQVAMRHLKECSDCQSSLREAKGLLAGLRGALSRDDLGKD